MEESLSKKAVKGVVWSAIERFSVQGVQFLLSIIIARLVSPEEYGLIAMLTIFMSLAQTFIDSGFSNALIQKKVRTEKDYSTVFIFNFIVAVIVYGVLWFSSSYIASFYNEPILETLTKVIGINLLLSSLSIVHKTKLIIDLDFKSQARISFATAVVSGGVGVLMAWKGYGVWALAVQSILFNLLSTVFLLLFIKLKLQFVFSVESFRTLFGFGSKLLVGSLLHTIYSNLYTAVIGKFFTSSIVGLFNRSQTFSHFFSVNFTEIISRAIFPVLCKVQGDQQRLKIGFLKYLKTITFIIFPLMILLAVLAKPFIIVLLTEKWIEAAKYLSILCIANMWNPVMFVNWQLLNVCGRSDLSLKSEMIKKIVAFIILIITLHYSVTIMCLGVLVYSLCDIAIDISFVKKVMPVGYMDEIKVLIPNIALNMAMTIPVFIVLHSVENPMLQLLLGGITGFLTYAILSYILKFEEMQLLHNLISKK